jgi:lipooligosaccharide transport system permease protein
MGLIVMPMFLFSGTFFPLTQLPDQVEWVAWLTPLFHGVELIRGAILDQMTLPAALVHIGYLLAMFAIGAYLSERNLTKRMAG